MISRKSSFAIGALTAVVIAGTGTAVAANGGSFLLGKKNTATTTTTLSNSKGTPLSLQGKKSAPPLKVNSTKKVKNLNADKVDGKSSSDFALKAGSTGYMSYESQWIDLDTDGTDDALLSIAFCPKGSKLTGGGSENYTGYPTFASAPVGTNAWAVLSLADPGTDTLDLLAYAVCYNPTGKVKGATSTLASATAESRPATGTLSKADMQRFARAAANR